jgi:hypothetical protein
VVCVPSPRLRKRLLPGNQPTVGDGARSGLPKRRSCDRAHPTPRRAFSYARLNCRDVTPRRAPGPDAACISRVRPFSLACARQLRRTTTSRSNVADR